jgi:hypothetical protein
MLEAFLHSQAPLHLLLVLLFRLAPFVVYALWNVRARPAAALTLSALSALSLLGLASQPSGFGVDLVFVCIGLFYFTAVTLSVHLFASSADTLGAGAKLGVFAALFVLYVVLPSRILPTSLWPVIVVIVHGFELALAGYSYCCASAGRDRRASLGNALFFMLVTPELVFPARGQHVPSRVADIGVALPRVVLGAAMMLAVVLLQGMSKPAAPPLSARAWSDGMVSGAIAFGLLYGSHSALAHLQIGLCRVVGYRAPERYHFPFAAVSPRDFWSRWNRYIALWLRCYVYAPLARYIAPAFPRPARMLITTLGAFLFLGLFHDAYFWLIERELTFMWTGGFLFWGLAVWLWSPIEPAGSEATGWQRLLHREASRVAFLCGLCLSVWVFL